MAKVHHLDFRLKLTEKEATTLFAFHMQMAIMLFEICPEDMPKRLQQTPASEDAELNTAIVEFVNTLTTIYDAWEKR